MYNVIPLSLGIKYPWTNWHAIKINQSVCGHNINWGYLPLKNVCVKRVILVMLSRNLYFMCMWLTHCFVVQNEQLRKDEICFKKNLENEEDFY